MLTRNLRWRWAPPAPFHMNRSCPALAEASAAARAAMFCSGMWSTVTATLFFWPQSLANWSNHLSKAGTKWLHWIIDSDLSAASPRETNGLDSTGTAPAAVSPAPAPARKRRRVKGERIDDAIRLPPRSHRAVRRPPSPGPAIAAQYADAGLPVPVRQINSWLGCMGWVCFFDLRLPVPVRSHRSISAAILTPSCPNDEFRVSRGSGRGRR